MGNLNIPSSSSIVRVRAIDTTTYMSLHTRRFMEPQLPGFETLNLTSVCFLIEHTRLKKTVLFDCGARKDIENNPPAIKARMNMIVKGLKIEKDVNEILVDAGVDLDSIDSIVWSHWHWDHVGAAEKFPTSVEIVVGPGFKENFIPAYPTVADAPLLDASFADRAVREISFTDGFRIGRFQAHDFFGDGSFYLLDSPGHAVGHVCGLARTTASTFVLLGGDICHFSGMHRPTTGLPLPDPVPSGHLDDGFPSPCPCSLFTAQHPLVPNDAAEARTVPFFEVNSVPPSSYLDRDLAMESIDKMQEFDESPDVLVCLAHEPALPLVLPLLNDEPGKTLNDWKAEGMKEKLLWRWLNELPRKGKPGRPMLVDGFWKDGKRVTDFTAL